MKKLLLILMIFILTACSPKEADFKSKIPITKPVAIPIANPSVPAPIKSAINLDVTFFSQAPDGDWGMPWQEACEEAASTLAYYYIAKKPLTKVKFKKDIKGLVAWQNKNFGDYKHSDIDQTAKMLREYFNFTHFKIIKDPTVDQMKQELSKGNVIVAPFAGRQLKNPFYTGLGPLYHMMVIKGYDKTHFITNDVGTRRGYNFIYPYKTIMSALHDWHDKDINKGVKKVIVLELKS